MEIQIKIGEQFTEEVIIIQSPKLSSEMESVLNYIKRLQRQKLKGKRKGKLYLLNINEVMRFYVENRKVIATDYSGKEYQIDWRLYQLEEMLDGEFIRISKSEIISILAIESLQMNSNGMIQINLKQQIVTFSSRHYLQKIKERLML